MVGKDGLYLQRCEKMAVLLVAGTETGARTSQPARQHNGSATNIEGAQLPT